MHKTSNIHEAIILRSNCLMLTCPLVANIHFFMLFTSSFRRYNNTSPLKNQIITFAFTKLN